MLYTLPAASANIPPHDPKNAVVNAAAVGLALSPHVETAAAAAAPNYALAVLVTGAVACAWAWAFAHRGQRPDTPRGPQ